MTDKPIQTVRTAPFAPNDPRRDIHRMQFREGQGEVFLYAGSLVSVRKEGPSTLAVTIKGCMTVYVKAKDGLLSELLRSMAACSEYEDAAAEVAAEAIR